MDGNGKPLPSEVIQQMDKLYESVHTGAAAEEVLKLLDPIIEERLGKLLQQLKACPPELGPILDIRAKICETWEMRRKIKIRQVAGRNAVSVIKGLFDV